MFLNLLLFARRLVLRRAFEKVEISRGLEHFQLNFSIVHLIEYVSDKFVQPMYVV